MKYGNTTVYDWEPYIIRNWTVNEIKNTIWSCVSTGQPTPGCVSVEALRFELIQRGEEPVGYHNT